MSLNFSRWFSWLIPAAKQQPAPAVDRARFGRWLDWLLQWEGTVYENDPDDPGGATKFGIDQRSHPKVNIRALTRDQAAAIYLDEAWQKMHADELPAGLGEVLANIAVNCGKVDAIKWLETALSMDANGTFDAVLLRQAKLANTRALCTALLDRTELHYRNIAKGNLHKYLPGWLNRNKSLAAFIKPLLDS